MSNEIKATIKVSIWNEDGLTIDEICAPLEQQGWDIVSAWITEEAEA